MTSLLSLDSHFLFFDEAEKESFDIDSFLSPTYDMLLSPLEGEAVLLTPFSSPLFKNLNENNPETLKADPGLFKEDPLDQVSPKLRRGYKKSDTLRSRQRKNNYIKDLERRVNELVNENNQLKERVCTLSSDKDRLETEVLRMQKIMRKNLPTDDMDLSQEELDIQLLSSNQLLDIKPNSKSTATILLILLLSFSLLFHHTVTSQPSYDIPTSNSSLSELSQNPKLEKDLKDKNLSQNLPKKVERETKSSQTGPQQKPIKRVIRHDKNTAQRSLKRRKAESKPTPPPVSLSTPLPTFSIDHRSVPELIQWRPNTTYLICNHVSQILPPSTSSVHHRQPMPVMVSLLIPPDALGHPQENALLEVICQVIDVSSVPLRLESV